MDIEIRCECGKILDDTMISSEYHEVFCEIEPCPDCIRVAVKEAQGAYEQND